MTLKNLKGSAHYSGSLRSLVLGDKIKEILRVRKKMVETG
jgi:hypothetical protein